MITLHSIDLTTTKEVCFALAYDGDCRVLIVPHRKCCSADCPFYKPKGCADWIRIEDRQGINLIPPEEAFEKRRR